MSMENIALTRIAYLYNILPYVTDRLDFIFILRLVNSSWDDCILNYGDSLWDIVFKNEHFQDKLSLIIYIMPCEFLKIVFKNFKDFGTKVRYIGGYWGIPSIKDCYEFRGPFKNKSFELDTDDDLCSNSSSSSWYGNFEYKSSISNLAIDFRKLEFVSFIFNKGFDIKPDNKKENILKMWFDSGSQEKDFDQKIKKDKDAIRLFFLHCVDFNVTFDSLRSIIRNCHYDVIEFFFEHCCDRFECSCAINFNLIPAISNFISCPSEKYLKKIELLLYYGADPDYTYIDKETDCCEICFDSEINDYESDPGSNSPGEYQEKDKIIIDYVYSRFYNNEFHEKYHETNDENEENEYTIYNIIDLLLFYGADIDLVTNEDFKFEYNVDNYKNTFIQFKYKVGNHSINDKKIDEYSINDKKINDKSIQYLPDLSEIEIKTRRPKLIKRHKDKRKQSV